MKKMFCAYLHCRPSGDVFYVGKGTLARARQVAAGRNQHYERVVSKYGAAAVEVGVLPCSTEQGAFALEVGLIRCFRRMGVGLTNITSGGEGHAGVKSTPEANAKRAAALRGRVVAALTRQKLSMASTGKPVSAEVRIRLSTIFKSRPMPAAFLARQGVKLYGAANPHAKAVVGAHPTHGKRRFDTATAAALSVGGSVSKICRAAKTGYRHMGWQFVYEGAS